MERWRKIGRIFRPGQYAWLHTHAQNPFPEPIGDGIFRVHFAARDKNNLARGAYFDFNINNPHTILNISTRPTIDLGALGTFDDSGVMPSCIIDYKGMRYMYYTGWSKAVTVPFSFHIGLAISKNGGKLYDRVSLAPVLGRSCHDPYITGAPYVIIENNIFKMWYVSATGWVLEKGSSKPKHYYTIKYAESQDGLFWKTNFDLCIPYKEGEYAIARPVVFKEDGIYEMWFSFRGGNDTYRMGTASSTDGKKWARDPESVGINISENGWDAEMICYAYPFYYKSTLYALYNGNGYGATGMGLAIADL